MKTEDHTPPANMPEQVIVMQDKAFAMRNPHKAFYLRVKKEKNDVDIIDLDNSATLNCAKKMAKEKGFSPTHWIDCENNMLSRIF